MSRKNYAALALVTRDVPPSHAVRAYNVVAPVSHRPFEIIGTAKGFAEAFESFYAKEFILFFSSDSP